jgi:O-antigen/teichoic acid export membrane protein
MAVDLKSKTISGVKWSSISMLGGTLLRFATLAVLARLSIEAKSLKFFHV